MTLICHDMPKGYYKLCNDLQCDKCNKKTEHYVSDYNDIVKCRQCGNTFKI
jgi:ribosomal protein L37AE/L43A